MTQRDAGSRGWGGVASFSSKDFTEACRQRNAKEICDHKEYESYKVAKFVDVSEPSKKTTQGSATHTYNDKVSPTKSDRRRDKGAARRH